MKRPADAPALPLVSLPMGALLVAQFLSALADNALLVAAIALVRSQGLHSLVPTLQEFFVLPFVLLAPFVGAIADAWPKGRVMFVANGLKCIGAALMMGGLNPLLAYGLVGVGAAAYSPAKYGILTQMFGHAQLVRANGALEGSTIAAILLGVLLGGHLADVSLTYAFSAVMGCYLAAAAANLLVPRLAAERPLGGVAVVGLLKRFVTATLQLLRDRDARFSLVGTSLFWGSGTTLRLLLFAWVPLALGVTDNQTPANLMGVVSIGIVLGAASAGAFVSLDKVNRALGAGLLLGPLIAALSQVHSLNAAALLLCAVGFCGGFFVVPLNALLQERGHVLVGAGQALAVQNFAENLFMLAFVGLYGAATARGVPADTAALGFGAALLLALALLTAARIARARR